MFNLYYITNKADMASYAHSCGINRIFVDLEVNGKQERQGHLDTLISDHSFADIFRIRSNLPKVDILARLNPFCDDTLSEVNQAIDAGANILMLPMFREQQEVFEFAQMVAGRAKIIPLVETLGAFESLQKITEVSGLSEIFIGLNDLHLDYGLSFMFEPLINGMMYDASRVLKAAKLPFGFGGISKIGQGLLPAELILAEHARLGSSSVILSRTFHNKSESLKELKLNIESKDIEDIYNLWKNLNLRKESQINLDSMKVEKIINDIIRTS